MKLFIPLARNPTSMDHATSPLDWDCLLHEVIHLYRDADPAHDFSHILRVCHNAEVIGAKEGADMEILLMAALLHDAGAGSKSLNSDQAWPAAVHLARDFLTRKGWKEEAQEQVLYAVKVHRYSMGILPETLEARILQDADRLDALGAVGIARVFLTGGDLKRRLYHPDDPFCKHRGPDDREWNLDHFYQKLLLLKDGMHTTTAREMAGRRTELMRRYLAELQREIEGWDWSEEEMVPDGGENDGTIGPARR